MVSKLGLYNSALRKIGERTIASLTEDRKPRRMLDSIWDDTLRFCLEQGHWNFAMRSVEIGASESIESEFGMRHVFTKPEDWIRTSGVSPDDRFQNPLIHYVDETEYWVADVDPIYVRYISVDPDYGLNLGIWPATYAEYVATRMAAEICQGVTQSASQFETLKRLEVRTKHDALSKDAMNEAQPKFMPTGSWVNSRRSSSSLAKRNPMRA